MGFIMAGCVFWEGAGADLGPLPGAACSPESIYYNHIGTKKVHIK